MPDAHCVEGLHPAGAPRLAHAKELKQDEGRATALLLLPPREEWLRNGEVHPSAWKSVASNGEPRERGNFQTSAQDGAHFVQLVPAFVLNSVAGGPVLARTPLSSD